MFLAGAQHWSEVWDKCTSLAGRFVVDRLIQQKLVDIPSIKHATFHVSFTKTDSCPSEMGSCGVPDSFGKGTCPKALQLR